MMYFNLYVVPCIVKKCCKNVKYYKSSLFCKQPNHQFFLFNACLLDTCDKCGNLSLLDEYLHENDLTTFGQQLVDIKRFKTIEYPLNDEKIGRICDLVMIKLVVMHLWMSLRV